MTRFLKILLRPRTGSRSSVCELAHVHGLRHTGSGSAAVEPQQEVASFRPVTVSRWNKRRRKPGSGFRENLWFLCTRNKPRPLTDPNPHQLAVLLTVATLMKGRLERTNKNPASPVRLVTDGRAPPPRTPLRSWLRSAGRSSVHLTAFIVAENERDTNSLA